jgi:hypothetical protein
LNNLQVLGGVYFATQMLSNVFSDPDKEKHEQARLRAASHLERLQRGRKHVNQNGEEVSDDSGSRRNIRIAELSLNNYENIIALDMVAPADIPVGFSGPNPWFSSLSVTLNLHGCS